MRAKFEQKLDLKIKLMMTGKYRLYEASTQFGGIGFAAHTALGREPAWDDSLVGHAMEVLRDEIREREPEWPTTYAFEYFRAIEKVHPYKIKKKTQFSEPNLRAMENKLEGLKMDWLAKGGDGLAKRLELIRETEEQTRKTLKLKRRNTEKAILKDREARLDREREMRALKITE